MEDGGRLSGSSIPVSACALCVLLARARASVFFSPVGVFLNAITHTLGTVKYIFHFVFQFRLSRAAPPYKNLTALCHHHELALRLMDGYTTSDDDG